MNSASQVPVGYKLTAVGVIPEEWKIIKFKKIVNDGRIPSGLYKEKNLYGTGTAIIKLGNVFKNDFFDSGAVQRVKLTTEEILSYEVKVGDIFIALASVKLEGVGKVMLVNSLIEPTTFDHNVALIRLKESYSPNFICNYFKSNYVRSLVASRATQVGTTFLKASTILNFSLVIPPTKTEQTAIANALSDADAWIQSLTRLIAKKRQIKQGAMQTLLNPYENGNLKTGWGFITYGKAFNFLSTAAFSRAELNQSVECGYVHYGDIHTLWNEFIDFKKHPVPGVNIDKAKRYAQLNEGDIIMADASEDYAGIGKSIEVKGIGDRKIISGLHTFLLRDKGGNFVNGFKGYIHLIEFVKKQFDRLATGLKVYGVSKGNLQLIEIPLPPKKEQTRIATILSGLDTEITTLENKLKKAQQIKQGMMQNLLTGRIRLVSPQKTNH